MAGVHRQGFDRASRAAVVECARRCARLWAAACCAPMDPRTFLPLIPLPVRGIVASLLDRLEELERQAAARSEGAQITADAVAELQQRVEALEGGAKPRADSFPHRAGLPATLR